MAHLLISAKARQLPLLQDKLSDIDTAGLEEFKGGVLGVAQGEDNDPSRFFALSLCGSANCDSGPSVCSPMRRRVTGQRDSKAILMQFLFLVPLDDERLWYRYHHLLADSLRVGLNKDELAIMHQKTTRWLSQNGFHTEAVRHALAAQDFGLAASYRALFATERGDYQRAKTFVEQVRTYLPPDDAISRARATRALGLAHECAGNVVVAIRTYRQAWAEYLEQVFRSDTNGRPTACTAKAPAISEPECLAWRPAPTARPGDWSMSQPYSSKCA